MIYPHDEYSGAVPAADPAEADGPPQVLVVDDSKIIRDIIVRLLRMSGYRALAAENGLAAQLLLQAEHPTLIISDLNMPLINGWELLAFCHAHHPDIPVLVISGEDLGKHPEIERWAAGFVAKPFDSKRFQAAVDQLISPAARRTRIP